VGNLTSLTDPVSNTTTFTYDALNRLIAVEYLDK
jgi:YD repeat-containing protein